MLISGFTDAYSSCCLTVSYLLVPGYFGLEAVVDRDAAPVVQLDAYRIQTQVLGERSSADTDQQDVTRQSLVLPSSRRLHSETPTCQHTKRLQTGSEGSGVFDSRHIDLAIGPLSGPHDFGAKLEL